jgi:REP element-mobilizing transposase RayT
MGQSLSKVYVHITFSTKKHFPLIDDQIEDSLFEYLGGICKGLNCNPVQVGGHKDHVHILCLLSKQISQSKLLEEIKKNSSKWIKTKDSKYSNFYWQDGYAIFSVNPTQPEVVARYIKAQKEHHVHTSFKDELRAFFKKYEVDFDERFVWD